MVSYRSVRSDFINNKSNKEKKHRLCKFPNYPIAYKFLPLTLLRNSTSSPVTLKTILMGDMDGLIYYLHLRSSSNEILIKCNIQPLPI